MTDFTALAVEGFPTQRQSNDKALSTHTLIPAWMKYFTGRRTTAQSIKLSIFFLFWKKKNTTKQTQSFNKEFKSLLFFLTELQASAMAPSVKYHLLHKAPGFAKSLYSSGNLSRWLHDMVPFDRKPACLVCCLSWRLERSARRSSSINQAEEKKTWETEICSQDWPEISHYTESTEKN